MFDSLFLHWGKDVSCPKEVCINVNKIIINITKILKSSQNEHKNIVV